MTSGGKRDGAGRPAIAQEKKRVQVTISVSPETMGRLAQIRKSNIKVGQVIDELVSEYFEKNF